MQFSNIKIWSAFLQNHKAALDFSITPKRGKNMAVKYIEAV